MILRYQIRLTHKAERDADNVLRWFADQHAMTAGTKWLSTLMARLNTLETNPERCPVAEESAALGLEIRELLLGKRRGVYRLLFQIKERTVYIVRIWHIARETPTADDLAL